MKTFRKMLPPVLKRNDKTAKWLILVVSFAVFSGIVLLSKVKLNIHPGFDVHIFATLNACINTVVTVLLLLAFSAVRRKNYVAHRNLMYAAIVLSVLFLLSYTAHHALAGDTKFGGTGAIRYFYFFILITHIILAGIILPFILFTAYRALTGDYKKHKMLARFTLPLWLYISITGVIVYLLISPYYT